MMKTNSGIANFVGLLICGILPQVLSITTTHHDKPPETKLSVMASKLQLKELQLNVTLPPGERQKRLLPYVNFYAQHSFNYPNRQAYINPQRYQIITPNPTSFQTFQHKFNELTGNNFQPKLVVDYRRVLQQPKIKLTPFTDTNALPGPFVPMRTAPQSVNYATIQQIGELPNYAAIYEKLSQLKLSQQGGQAGTAAYNQSPRYEAPQFIVNYVRKPQINYIPIREFQQDASGYIPPEQPTKTIIQTYTPTHVDVSPPFEPSSQLNPTKSYNEQHDTTPNAIRVMGTPVPTANNVQGRKQEITSTAGKPHQQTFKDEQQKIFEQQLKIYDDNQRIFVNEQKLQSGNPKQHVILHKVTPTIDQTYQLVPISNYNNVQKPKYETPQIQQNLVTVQKVDPIHEYETVEKIEPENNFATETYERLPLVNVYQSNVNNQPIETFQGITTTPDIHKVQTEMYDENLQAPISGYQVMGTTENTNSLAEILKNLQESNHLPQNLTPENIDNSIKTLVRILNVLKKQQRLSKKPIIVAEQQSDEQESEVDNETGVGLGGYDEDTITEIFPADTPEGGTPGKPGIDYPALSTIPRTSFDCKTQRYKGFFGDPDTNCQVWHYCDFNGGQASFLCPNGTIFSQVALTCDWWYNVKCSTTPQLYVLNERLYKYILPYSPKFPEDYSGPLVDRYLALKFQEMEEKMKKQRKKSKDEKDKSKNETEDVDDADELQLQNEENRKNSKERNDYEEQ